MRLNPFKPTPDKRPPLAPEAAAPTSPEAQAIAKTARESLKEKKLREEWLAESGAQELLKRLDEEREPVVTAIIEFDSIKEQLGWRPVKQAKDLSDQLDRQIYQKFKEVWEKLLAADERLEVAEFRVQKTFEPLAGPQNNIAKNRRSLDKIWEKIRQEYGLTKPLPAAGSEVLKNLEPAIKEVKEYAQKRAELESLMGRQLPEFLSEPGQLCADLQSAAVQVKCQGYVQDLLTLVERDGEFAKLGATSERLALLPRTKELFDLLTNIQDVSIQEQVRELRLKTWVDETLRSLREGLEEIVRVSERYQGLPLAEETRQKLATELKSLTGDIQHWSDLLQPNPALIESGQVQGQLKELQARIKKSFDAVFEAHLLTSQPSLESRLQPKGLLPAEISAERPELSKLIKREKEALNKFFGYEIAVPPPPPEITPEKYEQWQKLGFALHYLPAEDLAEPDPSGQVVPRDLPGWQKKPGKRFTSKEQWGIEFFDEIKKGNLPAAAAQLPGAWALIDERAKPNYQNGDQLYPNDQAIGQALAELREKKIIKDFKIKESRFNISNDELRKPEVKQALAKALDVPAASLRLPRAIECNFLGNAFYPEWGQTSTWEWFEDDYQQGRGRLLGGSSEGGGLSSVSWGSPGYRRGDLGFRLLVVFSSQK